MSCALSQRFSPDTPLIHRFFIGYDVTDELFGITIARKGYLNPCYKSTILSILEVIAKKSMSTSVTATMDSTTTKQQIMPEVLWEE